MHQSKFSSCIRYKVLGTASFYLSIKICQLHGVIRLSEARYFQTILKRIGMEEAKSLCTPGEPNLKKYPYPQLIGSLMYLIVATTLFVALAVNIFT